LISAAPVDAEGWPGLMSVGSDDFPERNGFKTPEPFVTAVAGEEGIAPGSTAGAVFAVAPGVSFAIFACKAAARFGSVSPFQPLSIFGAAIVAAAAGSEPGFILERVTVGAVMASTPPESCENFPFATGFVPALRVMRTEGIGWLPARTSALFTAWKFGPPLKTPRLPLTMFVTLFVFVMMPAFCARGMSTFAIERAPKSRAFTKL
jgi:hypothetical protein